MSCWKRTRKILIAPRKAEEFLEENADAITNKWKTSGRPLYLLHCKNGYQKFRPITINRKIF